MTTHPLHLARDVLAAAEKWPGQYPDVEIERAYVELAEAAREIMDRKIPAALAAVEEGHLDATRWILQGIDLDLLALLSDDSAVYASANERNTAQSPQSPSYRR